MIKRMALQVWATYVNLAVHGRCYNLRGFIHKRITIYLRKF